MNEHAEVTCRFLPQKNTVGMGKTVTPLRESENPEDKITFASNAVILLAD